MAVDTQYGKSQTTPQDAIQDYLPPLTISALAMRSWVGVLGTSLPLILLIGSISGLFDWQPSLSEYVNTPVAGQIFVGFLMIVGVFMIWYKPYEADKIPTTIAGVAAIGVALFPVVSSSPRTASFSPDFIEKVHGISAVAFFLALGYISLFLFTRSNKSKQDQPIEKRKRNQIYQINGYIIFACTILLILYIGAIMLNLIPLTVVNNLTQNVRPVLWLETISIIAFGISWFVKGESLARLSNFVVKRRK